MTTIIQAIILLLSTLFQAIILLLSTLQTSPCQRGEQELREHVSPVNTAALPGIPLPSARGIHTHQTYLQQPALADGTLSMAIQPCNLHTTPTAPPPTQPLHTQPLTTQHLPAQPPAHQAPLPAIQPPLLPATLHTTSSRRTRSYDTLRMQEEYSLVVQLTKVYAAGTTMRTFRKKRYIVEMKYAHLSTFLNL